MTRQPRSAIVTGASGGIGLAITQVLREEGFAVTMVSRSSEKLAAAAQSIRADPGPAVHTLAGSVADEDFLDRIVEFHSGEVGSLDVLVNNAGIAGNRAVGDITAEFLDAQLAVNVRAVVLLTSKSLPLLKEAVRLRNTAQVVNTASNAGKRGEATLSSYSATKFASSDSPRRCTTNSRHRGSRPPRSAPAWSIRRWRTAIAGRSRPRR